MNTDWYGLTEQSSKSAAACRSAADACSESHDLNCTVLSDGAMSSRIENVAINHVLPLKINPMTFSWAKSIYIFF